MSTDGKSRKKRTAPPATPAQAPAAEEEEVADARKGAASESGESEGGASAGSATAGDGEAEATQGGRAAAPRVTNYGKRKTTIIARVSGVVDSVSIGEGNGHERVFMAKPTGDEPDGTWTTAQIKMLWHFFEQAHRNAKKNAVHSERYEKMMRIGNGAEGFVGDSGEPEESNGFVPKRQKRGKGASTTDAAFLPENVPDGSGLPKQVWRTRPLPASLTKLWKGRYYLSIKDGTRDRHGNPYAIPLGKTGSYMGMFPHAICHEAQRGREPSTAPFPCYYCSESNNITVEVQLMQRRDLGKGEVNAEVSECRVMEELKGKFSEAERQNWGYYECAFGVHLQLEFAQGGEEHNDEKVVEDLLINPYHTSAGCAFKKVLQGDKLLVPFESDVLYSTSHYEGVTEGGRVAFKKFKLNTGTSSSKLVERYKHRKYQFVARVTNPFFVGLIEPVRSVPFRVKSVIYNDLKGDDRFVRSRDGEIVASPVEDAP